MWPARVHCIFWEKTRKQDAAISVQWLYRKEQCIGISDFENLYSDPRERLFSHHFDEVQVPSCISKCTVCFLPKKVENVKADYFARLFFDQVAHSVRPLTRADINWLPPTDEPDLDAVDEKDTDGIVEKESEENEHMQRVEGGEPNQKKQNVTTKIN